MSIQPAEDSARDELAKRLERIESAMGEFYKELIDAKAAKMDPVVVADRIAAIMEWSS
jgi:hypothetical protein